MRILSERRISSCPSYDLVYEWEDIFSDNLGAAIHELPQSFNSRVVKMLPFANRLFTHGEKSFHFDMTAHGRKNVLNAKECLICVIDFYLREKEIAAFNHAHGKCAAVLVSSREAYEFLKSNGSALNLLHFPLSISDKYAITPYTKFDKPYDLVLMGRQNKVLQGFLQQYADIHKDFEYIYREQTGKDFKYFTSKGTCIGNVNTRREYMELMRMAKAALYATPGTDDSTGRTKGFSQVTPRFLELVSAGCHIIARYRKNPDTDFYELEKFSPNVVTYGQFEQLLDKARHTEADMRMYSDYLAKHYTSVRAAQLKEIIQTI